MSKSWPQQGDPSGPAAPQLADEPAHRSARRGYFEPAEEQFIDANSGSPNFNAPNSTDAHSSGAHFNGTQLTAGPTVAPRRALAPTSSAEASEALPQPASHSTYQPNSSNKRAHFLLAAGLILLILLAVIAAALIATQADRLVRPKRLGDDYQVSAPAENFLVPEYRNGATLREIPSPKAVGFDRISGSYVLNTGAGLAAFDLYSGDQIWAIERVNCSEGSAGLIYCASGLANEKIQRVDYRTGQLIDSYTRPSTQFFGIELLGVKDGVEYFLFRGFPNVLAAGKADAWIWRQELPDEGEMRCEMLAAQIGCASGNSLQLFDLDMGKKELNLTGDYSLVSWLGDGYLNYDKNNKISHAFDLTGKDLGPASLPLVSQPVGLYSLADVSRADAAVVDANGRIVVKRLADGENYAFSSGAKLHGHHRWAGGSADGSVLAASKDDTLKLLNDRGEVIETISDVSVPTLSQQLLSVKQRDKYYLLVPKK